MDNSEETFLKRNNFILISTKIFYLSFETTRENTKYTIDKGGEDFQRGVLKMDKR